MGELIKINAKKPLSTKENSTSNKQKTGFQSQSTHVDQILFLQRTIGNQAVQRLMRSGALQAKLRIGQPGDVYEQEADRVADEVMRMPEPEMQRQVEPEEEEEEILQTKPLVDQITPLVQRQVEEEEEEMLQAKSMEDATPEVSNDLESQINAIKGGGRPLAESERAYFEPRFGGDFSQVRVHTGAQAVESARVVNAKAFTTGKDVVFGAGQYSPETSSGKRLLAHELTHVVQQGGNANHTIDRMIQREQSNVEQGDPPCQGVRVYFHHWFTHNNQRIDMYFRNNQRIGTVQAWRTHLSSDQGQSGTCDVQYNNSTERIETHLLYNSVDECCNCFSGNLRWNFVGTLLTRNVSQNQANLTLVGCTGNECCTINRRFQYTFSQVVATGIGNATVTVSVRGSIEIDGLIRPNGTMQTP